MLGDQTIYIISTEYQIKKTETTVHTKTEKENPTDVN